MTVSVDILKKGRCALHCAPPLSFQWLGLRGRERAEPIERTLERNRSFRFAGRIRSLRGASPVNGHSPHSKQAILAHGYEHGLAFDSGVAQQAVIKAQVRAGDFQFAKLIYAGRSPVTLFHAAGDRLDRKSTRLNSSHLGISYAVFCL